MRDFLRFFLSTFTDHHRLLSVTRILPFTVQSTEPGLFQASRQPCLLFLERKGQVSGDWTGPAYGPAQCGGERDTPRALGTPGLGGPGDAARAFPQAYGSAQLHRGGSAALRAAAPRLVSGRQGPGAQPTPASVEPLLRPSKGASVLRWSAHFL